MDKQASKMHPKSLSKDAVSNGLFSKLTAGRYVNIQLIKYVAGREK